jgi:hypothetical protein
MRNLGEKRHEGHYQGRGKEMGMGRLSEGNKGVNIIKVHYMY